MSNNITHHLKQYDAAADADKFPLARHWMDTEPLAFFKELREKRPILVMPSIRAQGSVDYKSGPFPEQYDLSWGVVS